MIDWWTGLPETLDQVWLRLNRGVADRRACARHPTLATLGARGPEARIVVLRGVDKSLAELSVHTDLRSAKVSELSAEPRASLLIWEQKTRLQIRLRVNVSVKSGKPAATDWQQVPETARKVYGAHPAPGSPMEKPEQLVQHSDPMAFAVLVCRMTEIETLYLGDGLHRRAIFRRDNAWAGSWIAP